MNKQKIQASKKELKRLLQRKKWCETENEEFYKDFPEEHQRISPTPKILDKAMRYYSIGEIIRWKIMSFEEVESCLKLEEEKLKIIKKNNYYPKPFDKATGKYY